MTKAFTLLLTVCIFVVVQCITDTQRTEILNLHNSVRKCAGLQPLVWDYNLEKVGQDWANTCNFAHNANRETDYQKLGGTLRVGENIANGGGSSGGYGMAQLFQFWWDEKKLYTCGQKIGEGNSFSAGHYTQIMWGDSSRLGCGVAQCDQGFPLNYLVCDYATAGNWYGELPYPTNQCPDLNSCTPSTAGGTVNPPTQAPATSTSKSTSKGSPTVAPPTMVPTSAVPTSAVPTSDAPIPTSQAPTQDVPYVPIEVLVTATLAVAPGSVSVQTFAFEVTGVLAIPSTAISNIQVDIDKSTDASTVIHFTLLNVLQPDGTRVDPVNAAFRLRDLAKNRDPALSTTAMLMNMEVNDVEQQQMASSENFVQSQAFVIIIACVAGAVFIAVAVTITIIVVKKRRTSWF